MQVLHDGSHSKHPTGVAISDGRQDCVQALGEKPDIHFCPFGEQKPEHPLHEFGMKYAKLQVEGLYVDEQLDERPSQQEFVIY